MARNAGFRSTLKRLLFLPDNKNLDLHIIMAMIASWSLREDLDLSAFECSRAHVENEVMVRLLEHVDENPQISQRALSTQVCIAFGLVNTYLKRSVEKGWVRVKNISPKRYAYFVTPQGMAEKARMVKDYMGHSLSLFREARAQTDVFFTEAEQHGYKTIAIVGSTLRSLQCQPTGSSTQERQSNTVHNLP